VFTTLISVSLGILLSLFLQRMILMSIMVLRLGLPLRIVIQILLRKKPVKFINTFLLGRPSSVLIQRLKNLKRLLKVQIGI